jgi:excisionase family DNA binding protein
MSLSFTGRLGMKIERQTIERRGLSVLEAAAMLGISRSQVYRLMETGTLQTTRLGGRRIVPVAAVDQLLSAGK